MRDVLSGCDLGEHLHLDEISPADIAVVTKRYRDIPVCLGEINLNLSGRSDHSIHRRV